MLCKPTSLIKILPREAKTSESQSIGAAYCTKKLVLTVDRFGQVRPKDFLPK
jgi:hypothetical protein